jgi:ATP-dependent DNA helicase RecG
MTDFLESNIMYLQGVGPKRAELLSKELNIITFKDLLYHFPYKYIDRTRFYKINELDQDLPLVQIKGILRGYYAEGKGSGKRLVADFSDETGSLKLVWFKGLKWVTSSFPAGNEFIIFGKPSVFNGIIILYIPKLKRLKRKLKDLTPHFRPNTVLLKSLRTAL